MVVDIDNLHIHSGKHTPYVEGCGPQGPIFEYKGPAFSWQLRQPLGSGSV